MKTIIIDDEKNGRTILKKLIEKYCSGVTVIGEASNIASGHELIMTQNPDLIFLDIEMPNGNGFDLLSRFDSIRFQVIFTTAFDNYAIKAIKYKAFDYLLKPIDIDELRLAIENAKKHFMLTSINNHRNSEFASDKNSKHSNNIALPVKDGTVFVSVTDVVRIESDGSYSIVYTVDSHKYMVSKNLKEYEDLLIMDGFFRVHKCHLVNINKVKKYLRIDGHYVEMSDGSKVEIARRKKDDFLKAMGQ